MVLSAGELDNLAIVERCEQSWLSDSVTEVITKAELTLISISTPIDLVIHGHKDRMPAAGFDYFDWHVPKGPL